MIVAGVLMPAAPTPVALIEMSEMVKAAEPLLLSVTFCVAVEPTVTFPKLMEVGVMVN